MSKLARCEAPVWVLHAGALPARICNFALIVFCLVGVSAGWASDNAKEQRWAEQITDALLDGEPVNLHTGSQQFLAIHTAPEVTSARGAVIMHGTGVHPDWQTVIYPLRVGLAERGFRTLSIQMPVLANDAEQRDYVPLFAEAPPRIDAALDYLRGQGVTELYLIGHSLGAGMGTYYLRDGKANVNGFVAVGLAGGFKGTAMDNLAHLAGVGVPMLDLYGSDDLREVVAQASARENAASNNRGYTQYRAEGADHFFDGEEDELLDAVSSWLGARSGG